MLFPLVDDIIDGNGDKVSKEDSVKIPVEVLNSEDNEGDDDTYQGILDRVVKTFALQAFRTILTTYRCMSME